MLAERYSLFRNVGWYRIVRRHVALQKPLSAMSMPDVQLLAVRAKLCWFARTSDAVDMMFSGAVLMFVSWITTGCVFPCSGMLPKLSSNRLSATSGVIPLPDSGTD